MSAVTAEEHHGIRQEWLDQRHLKLWRQQWFVECRGRTTFASLASWVHWLAESRGNRYVADSAGK